MRFCTRWRLQPRAPPLETFLMCNSRRKRTGRGDVIVIENQLVAVADVSCPLSPPPLGMAFRLHIVPNCPRGHSFNSGGGGHLGHHVLIYCEPILSVIDNFWWLCYRFKGMDRRTFCPGPSLTSLLTSCITNENADFFINIENFLDYFLIHITRAH